MFVKYPNLVSFSWTQYTPYFNDGDTCYFSVNCDAEYITTEFIEDNGESILGYDRESLTIWKNGEYVTNPNVPELDKTAHEVSEIVSNLLSEISNDVFLILFGDHVEVIVTKNGIEKEDHDHD